MIGGSGQAAGAGSTNGSVAAAATVTKKSLATTTTTIGAASSAAAPVGEERAESKMSLKFEVCIDTLMAGCVNAYVQLFELSHRPPVCVDELAGKMFSVPDDKLPWVQSALINVEIHRRRSNFRESFNESIALAKYFEENGDTAQAVLHHKNALQHASESLNRVLEGEAHEAIGLLYERLGRIPESVVHHETRLRLAEITGDSGPKVRASKNLLRVYMVRGADALRHGDPETARSFYEKSVATAKAAGDTGAEAEAYKALGEVTVLLGDMNRALEYQKRFMVVSREAKDAHAEARAAIEVAKLQEQLGQTNDAIQSLKASLDLAEQTNDLPAIFNGCNRLGEVYAHIDQPRRAVHYFQQAFKVAQDMAEPSLVEQARISLGFALGEHYFTHGDAGFLGVCCTDLATQLEWMGSGVL